MKVYLKISQKKKKKNQSETQIAPNPMLQSLATPLTQSWQKPEPYSLKTKTEGLSNGGNLAQVQVGL